ncbi:MAG: hypothetical protein GQ572_10855, partial [Gammaproteobacteria bacterium]|nr:hypothetical protein [Gammaproteobacteria bacterium]
MSGLNIIIKTGLVSLLAISCLATSSSWAKEKSSGHPGTPESEMRYKGAPIPIDPGEAKETISPKAPPVTTAEFARAKQIF